MDAAFGNTITLVMLCPKGKINQGIICVFYIAKGCVSGYATISFSNNFDNMKYLNKIIILILFSLQLFVVQSQVDHYAAVVVEGDKWQYYIPSQEPSQDWIQNTFDESEWSTGSVLKIH